MSFSAFRASIDEPRLIQVVDHWAAARGERTMPVWPDIDPLVLGRLLPIVWSWRWDPKAEDFVGRLAGDAIERVLGFSIRGRRMGDLFAPATARLIRGRYLDVLRTPQFMGTTGRIYGKFGGAGLGERVVLPLAPDGKGSGGVFGATVYRLDAAAQQGATRLEPQGETRRLFPLDAVAPLVVEPCP